MGLPARKINQGSERRIEEMALSQDGKRLIFIFENGEGYSIPRFQLPGDDGTPITNLQIFDHRGAVVVTQSSGQCYDLPWDSIKHYARGGVQKKIALGKRLRELREGRELTQEALARAVGLSRAQINRIEGNLSQPQVDSLVNICHVLGISPTELI